MSFQYGILELEEGKWYFSYRSLQGIQKNHFFNDTHKPALLEILDRLGAGGWEFEGKLALCNHTPQSLVFIRRK